MYAKSNDFRSKIQTLMAQVPLGKVTTYGDLAAMAGSPYAARQVGGVAHYGDQQLPWHRLVNCNGGLASGYYGGKETQAAHLLAEGITCTDGVVDDFERLRWHPL